VWTRNRFELGTRGFSKSSGAQGRTRKGNGGGGGQLGTTWRKENGRKRERERERGPGAVVGSGDRGVGMALGSAIGGDNVRS
jgi:hypothetical protein